MFFRGREGYLRKEKIFLSAPVFFSKKSDGGCPRYHGLKGMYILT